MNENLKFSISNVVAWEDVAACFEAHVTENVKVVFAKENTNLALIPCRLTSVL